MVQRLTYRKRHSYATKSNQTRVVKTPGKYLILASLICFRACLIFSGFRFCAVPFVWSDLGNGVDLEAQAGSLCINTRTRGRVGRNIPHLRPAQYSRSRLSRNRRSVNRAYGGVLSGSAVRERLAIKCC
ncbi:hypothetical protein GW17_00030015 [Ensete ventricosum]|nr:hypothetical protein GW17_00030015 [Ensete ventricosum]RZR97293.1 hypothetical protein BHM03_00026448 [Ensete ventricosum]